MPAGVAALLQFGGSLLAILALFWVTRKLALGGDTRIRDEAEARALAQEADCSFEPIDVAIDRAGMGALLRDGDGRIMLLRRHGSHFASRLLDTHTHARLDRTQLTLATSDRWFGSVTFDLGENAARWAARLRSITC